jgi:hypothetical protein
MAEALAADVLPTVDDEYARAQLAACVELLGNLATRVEWRRDQLDAVTARANDAVRVTLAAVPDAASVLPPEGQPDGTVEARDRALARVSALVRWCDRGDVDSEGVAPLLEFARWHVEHERALARRG